VDERIRAVEYAKIKKVSPMAVSKWVEGGKLGPLGDAVIKAGRRYKIDPFKADQYLDVNVKMTNQRLFNDDGLADLPPVGADDLPPGDNGSQKTSGTVPDSYRQATTSKIRYEALLRQQEYEIKSGKYILADEARSTFFNKARTFRDAMLNIPPRIGRIMVAEAYDAISTELATLLDEVPYSLLEKLQALVISRTELIMKSEIEQTLKELAT
jgi:hypothetical protein